MPKTLKMLVALARVFLLVSLYRKLTSCGAVRLGDLQDRHNRSRTMRAKIPPTTAPITIFVLNDGLEEVEVEADADVDAEDEDELGSGCDDDEEVLGLAKVVVGAGNERERVVVPVGVMVA